jgi:hypothetical protein
MGNPSEEPRRLLSEPGSRSPEPGFPDEPPPFGGSWRALYAVVAGALAALIVLFYAFTRGFE